jgi:site-specific DNA-methyltransferase (adenine-specific)
MNNNLEQQTIVVGDCLHCLNDIAEESIDVVVTSPPYNLGIAYGSYEDHKPREQYLLWLREVAIALRRVMKPDASFFLNIGSTNVDPWLSMDVSAVFRDYFVLQNHIIWIKSINIGDDTLGHFKPINSPRFLNHNHEAIFQFSKTGKVPIDRLSIGTAYQDKSNIARRGHAQDKHCAGNTWYIPYETVQSKAQKFDHPASFPIELALRCIKLHGVSKAVVLDPFVGIGTTLIAAARLGCSGIGIEMDAQYAATAVARLEAQQAI